MALSDLYSEPVLIGVTVDCPLDESDEAECTAVLDYVRLPTPEAIKQAKDLGVGGLAPLVLSPERRPITRAALVQIIKAAIG